MSVVDTLIIDRTSADVSRRAYLKERVKNGAATAEEAAEWLTDLKGAYNASDLNRVGAACAYIYRLCAEVDMPVRGYAALRTDRTGSDIPTPAEMQTYLATVAALKAAVSATQELPASMSGSTFEDWNNIEKLLVEVDRLLRNVVQSFVYSGMVYSGQLWG